MIDKIYDYWLVDINDPKSNAKLLNMTNEEVKTFVKENTNIDNKKIRLIDSGGRGFVIQELYQGQWDTLSSAQAYDYPEEASDKSQAIAIVRQMMLLENDSIIKTHALEILDRLLSKLVL